MNYCDSFTIGASTISADSPTYFIADVAANHDGELSRAKDLIWRAKEAGADCAKFQHYVANRIVSDVGFADGVGQVSHQAAWEKPVDRIYDQYHTRRDWTEALLETCREADIEFMTTPYDAEAVEMFGDVVNAFKVGSGDITFHTLIEQIASKKKPVLIATGAADMDDTVAAVDAVLKTHDEICVMQCNTNYTGSIDNFRFVNLNVIQTFAQKWPGMPIGFSDHTPGHSAVLGAVALGARVVEKHFTDDNARIGPDHDFALNPTTWRAMVDGTRELESAMGDGVKRIEENERETVVIQRRALRAAADIAAGTVLTRDHLEALRPCPAGAVTPAQEDAIIGKTINRDLPRGSEVVWDILD